MGEYHSLSGLQQDELAYPMHHMLPQTTPCNHVPELSNATMIPQMTLAVNMTGSEG